MVKNEASSPPGIGDISERETFLGVPAISSILGRAGHLGVSFQGERGP